jgi:hypothetical protein
MVARILLMGAPYLIPPHALKSPQLSFGYSGLNTGNLLIGNGLYGQLDAESVAIHRAEMSAEYVEENFDLVAIAAANFLFPGFDLSPISRFLDRIRLPAFMVGLGAQLPSAKEDLANIPAGTWRLMSIVSERSTSIGVRGHFTAEQLDKLGYKNIRVTGCPSLYTHLQPVTRIKRPENVTARTVYNGSRNVMDHAFDSGAARNVERQLLQLAMAGDHPFILQNEKPELQIAAGEHPELFRKDLVKLARFFETDADTLGAYYRSRGTYFYSTREWFEWIRGYDFSIGTRFHGNLAALINGVPAVVLTHDSRTRELCELAAIPHASIENIGKLDPQALYEAADYDLYEQRYNSLYRAYVEFLDENGVPHKLRWRVDNVPRGGIRFAAPAERMPPEAYEDASEVELVEMEGEAVDLAGDPVDDEDADAVGGEAPDAVSAEDAPAEVEDTDAVAPSESDS